MLTRLEETFARESRFSADAAHEFKTPLTVIKTNLDVLYLDDNPTKQECLESLEIVKKQTSRMINLVEDLLAMSTVNGCRIDRLVQVNDFKNKYWGKVPKDYGVIYDTRETSNRKDILYEPKRNKVHRKVSQLSN